MTRASTWRDDPELAWRYPFHVDRLEKLDIPAFPLVNLWDGEDDQIPELRETAARLELRDPIIGNLYRDGGEGLSDQIDAFVDVLSNASMPSKHDSHKGMALLDAQRVADLPTAPQNLSQQVPVNVEFWIDHGEQLEQRFNAWAAR